MQFISFSNLIMNIQLILKFLLELINFIFLTFFIK